MNRNFLFLAVYVSLMGTAILTGVVAIAYMMTHV